MTEQSEIQRPPAFNPKLALGVSLIVLGIAVALDNLNLVKFHFIGKLWPLVLVVFGFIKVRRDNSTSGYVLMLMGLFLLLMMFGHGDLSDLIFPAILVSGGIMVITKTLRKHRGMPDELRGTENVLSGSAIFCGFKRRVLTQTFQGGELTAIFGGFEADLRQAAISDQRARVDVFVLFGGGELKVPDGWEVDVQATAIAGGIEDKTYTHGEAHQEGRPRLLITGLVLFGGLEVRN